MIMELREDLAQSGPDDRARILALIAQRHYRAAREMVADLLADGGDLAFHALQTLAVLGRGGAETVDKVVALCSTGDERLRVAALECLTAWADRRLLPVLISRLDDAGVVAAAAERGLMAFSDAPHGRDAQAWRAWYDSRFGPMEKAAAGSVAQLRSHDPKLVVDAIRALAMFNDLRAEHADLIAPLQRDPDRGVAAAAIAAMRVIRPEACLPPAPGLRCEVPVPVVAAAAPSAPSAPRKSLFDTWTGLVVVLALPIFGMCVMLYVFRQPKVREMTQQFVRPAARALRPVTDRLGATARHMRKRFGPITEAVVRRVSNGTRRLTRPIARRMGEATERMLRPVRRADPGIQAAASPAQNAPALPENDFGS
ncbi:MAG: hypothetical protein H0X38_10750 [Planctomycetes bacterium]|nr:hypothetical protein [Planctomycetota bacterium]